MSGVINRPSFTTQGKRREVGTTIDSPDGTIKLTISVTKMLQHMPTEQIMELQLQVQDELLRRRGNGR